MQLPPNDGQGEPRFLMGGNLSFAPAAAPAHYATSRERLSPRHRRASAQIFWPHPAATFEVFSGLVFPF